MSFIFETRLRMSKCSLCLIYAFHVILWLMDVVAVSFASVGSIVCVEQNKQFFSPQWFSYFKQMKRFLSNINMSNGLHNFGNIFRGNDVERVLRPLVNMLYLT